MYLETMSAMFVEGIDSFVKASKVYVANNVWSKGYIHCPCVDCKNEKQFKNIEQIRFHMLSSGIMKNIRFGISLASRVRTYRRKSHVM